jgi:hypothetical protein
MLTFLLLVSTSLLVTVGCATTATDTAGAPVLTSEKEMAHGAEAHQPAHEGQVGMARAAASDGADLHLEVVSATPGHYLVYLSDEQRQPIPPEGYEGTVAVIKPDGSEIASLPLKAKGDHLIAEGGPTAGSQLDVRITLKGPGLVDKLEMDFTLSYTQ